MLIISGIINLFRLTFLFLISCHICLFSKHRSIRFFLKFSGPTFIKLGQLLSNRPDLVGDVLAEELAHFQDSLPAFSFKKAKKIIETSFFQPLNKIFSEFNHIPVASASVAQVYKAKTLDGNWVAVKILRPNISALVKRDMATLKLLSIPIGFFSSYVKEKIINIIHLLEDCAKKELDLFCEASAAAEFREKMLDVNGFYVPKIYWEFVSHKVLTIEWISGVPFSNRKKIHEEIVARGFDEVEIARNLVISYFNQVYVHGFFHADMHGGNLFLMENGNIGVVDFGIMGSIDKKTRIAITEIIIAFLKRDYKKVAQLHIDAGLVPNNIDLNEFVLSCRIIGELVVDKSVGQVSMAKLLGHLLKMTRKYQMQTKPELLLLQKTMMLVEGVGVFLNKDLNIWDLAKPFVEEWATKNIGFDAKVRDFVFDLWQVFKRLPEILTNQK